MAKLKTIAREAGLNPLTCPMCGRRVRTDSAIRLLFTRLLQYVLNGEAVTIRGFGRFVRRETRNGDPVVDFMPAPGGADERKDTDG
jgi:nucleoid DNA-binding protein